MPEIYCDKCGIDAQPTDRFCRICGSSLTSTSQAVVHVQNARSDQNEDRLDGRTVVSSPNSPLSIRTACLITAGLLFFTLVLVMIFIISLVSQTGGRSVIAIEQIGTSTPYPTRAPYRTDLPYTTATSYPTAIPYPTTGAMSTAAPGQPFQWALDFKRDCQIRVKNQSTDLDSVVILSTIDTNVIVAAMFVRANDSFEKWGIPAGSYYTYVALGLDWDNMTGRFKNNASYFRFEEPTTFNTCLAGHGDYDFSEITLLPAEESAPGIIYLQPESFPGIFP